MQFANERIRNIPGLFVMAYRYLYEQRKKERKRGRFHKRQARGLIAFVAFFQLFNCDVKPPLSSKKIVDGTRLDPRPVGYRLSIRKEIIVKDRKIKTHLGSMLTVAEQTINCGIIINITGHRHASISFMLAPFRLCSLNVILRRLPPESLIAFTLIVQRGLPRRSICWSTQPTKQSSLTASVFTSLPGFTDTRHAAFRGNQNHDQQGEATIYKYSPNIFHIVTTQSL
ncbi:hypothetical protein [Burkholderia multivorans]|uniref:hypothetical protein n=1 Tax=Burkholderia multivorans TaxID=87883 RepID=UPI0021BE723D|nr:hypothetical protein [Burkholderia multivorans]MDR9051141.1 hypothetical protein [Burkholderia multivorans]MDR9059584.1 hypothetical protein [Burkholderia multivorans]MDR9061384.1 hypothetical protein [Burkholderia multivorans]MDR9071305.1 hypothetical protein [Burkholderia multivorans]MDR9074524.1 hypothetical protein [Burkholderia multivorans]